MKISILIPIYNEQESVKPLLDEIVAVVNDLKNDYEIICVNDGSSDDSGKILCEIAINNNNLKIINFRRNYGQTAALMAAITHSSGDILVPMDGDLQNDPRDILKLIDKINEGYDVVSGWRIHRKDKKTSRLLPSKIANWLISKISGVNLHDYGCTLKAYKRDVIENIKLYGEMHRFIPIYAFWEGARITELPVNHRARQYGESKYGLSRIIRVILDMILIRFLQKAFDRPIQFFGKMGIYSIGFAVISGTYGVILKVFYDTSFIQTPLPLLAVFLTLSGILFILLGLIAEIQIRIYYEGQSKMPYQISNKKNFP